MSPPAGSAARPAADAALGEDIVVPFQVARLGVRGRLARLGPMVTGILSGHDYPEPVSRLLAEAVALTAMLGTALKFDGRFILQTKTDGPVDMLVADLTAPGAMRGYAHFDAERVVGELHERGTAGPEALLGRGHLAMTIDPGAGMERYQGVVPLEESDLAEAANLYFRQSEQIPTRTCLAAGVIVEPGAGGRSWRAGGLLVQHLPESLGGGADAGRVFEVPATSDEGDGWRKAEALVATIQDHELLDPALSPLRLLYQLFHEDGVTAAPVRPLERHCSCSREAVATMLRQFSKDELADMVEEGRIGVTCEFCSSHYDFDPSEFDLD